MEQSEIIDLYHSRSPFKRGPEENLDELQQEQRKRTKMRDIDSILRFGGLKKCSKLAEAKVNGCQGKDEEASVITDMAAPLRSDKPADLMISNSSIEPTNDTCLSLRLADTVESSENLLKNVAPQKLDEEHDAHNITPFGLSLNLNDNPFHPFKKLGEVRLVDASECGSTTGPLEESEPLRVWKEMKQNGFLSSSHGGIPVPKQQGHQIKRKKLEVIKKKCDTIKGEPPNKYSGTAAPTGLLAGLNPGIIKNVRNSKQVKSIIEAMLQFENINGQMENGTIKHFRTECKDAAANDSVSEKFFLYPGGASFLFSSTYGERKSGSEHTGRFDDESSQFTLDDDDDSLTLKLPSAITRVSENISSTSNNEISASHDSIAYLSLKGASVASQWLGLLQQDIKGRLAALRRSKQRVRNVIQIELPYLLSKELLSNQNHEGYFAHSSDRGCSMKENFDVHMAHWKSIFCQMDKALYEEEKHLENWLKEVKDMHTHCEAGLTFLDAHCTVLPAEGLSGLKKREAVERENAVRAAAASIYSTCNFVVTKENVPCF